MEKEMAKKELEQKVQKLYDTFSSMTKEDQRQEVEELFQRIVNENQ